MSVRSELTSQYNPGARFENFGSVIERLRIMGFRGHLATSIDFIHPVTALAGPNGSGKSTVLEVAACCYANGSGETYQVSDFFPVGELDRTPFSADASVEVSYCRAATNPEKGPQVLTISRDAEASRRRGYDRRPEKAVLFLGHGRHLPRSERRDLLREIAENGILTGSTEFPAIVRESASAILSSQYTLVNETAIALNSDGARAIVVERNGLACSYSELQMGCGEARVLWLVGALESAPDRSLVLLEEPESAVHFAAQGRLGHYLLDVALRKRHQIVLTTHSEHLLRTLPTESRVYLQPNADGLIPIPGLTSAEAASLMSEGFDAALVILVEDECARQVLQQLMDHVDREFLKTVKIVVGGYSDKGGNLVGSGAANIRKAMATVAKVPVRIVAVLDGDQTQNTEQFVYKLPGTKPPEKSLFDSAAVHDMWRKQYGLDVPAFLASVATVDHHQLFNHLARRVNLDQDFLIGEAARAYAPTVAVTELNTLIKYLKDATGRA